MRILAFSTDDHLYPAGGAEQAFGNITKRLPHIEFDLICAKLRKGAKGYEQVGNVRIHRMGFGVPKIDGIVLALFGHYCAKKLMRKRQYDLIWSIMASYGAFSAVRVKRKTKLPFLLTLQEGDSPEHIYEQVKYVRRSFNEIFRATDGIQAISHYLLAWGKKMGYRGQHATVIPNGVDVESFSQAFSSGEIQKKRDSFGFPENAVILMTSSRLEKKNGIGDVIEALRDLPTHVCFLICGSGSLEESLKRKIKTYNLNGRVRFLGFVEPKALPLIMQASDIFIRPSYTEGLGNAFLEAMAARKIVIGTHAGGIADFLVDEKTGFVVEIGNPKSIKETVEKVLSLDSAKREEITVTAETIVREKYNWEKIAKDMENMFNTLVS